MVLSKSKPNKASHMRLKDRTVHRLHMLGQALCLCGSVGQGSSSQCSGRPAPPLLWALGVSVMTLSLQGFSAWTAPADWGLEQWLSSGWGSEPVALPAVLRNLGEGSHAPMVPVLSV